MNINDYEVIKKGDKVYILETSPMYPGYTGTYQSSTGDYEGNQEWILIDLYFEPIQSLTKQIPTTAKIPSEFVRYLGRP